MKILICDVAASSGGALSILQMFYENALKDENNNYVFIISTPNMKSDKNIEIIKYPWIKKSWFHRLYFDKFIVNKLIKKINPDKIYSLQNTYVGKSRVPQTIYIHQPLAFTDFNFSIIIHPKMWIYKNIISKIIKKSVSKADEIIVQTEWMKKSCSEFIDVSKIKQEEPDNPWINIDYMCKKNGSGDLALFYPASPIVYKNHLNLLKAINVLKNNGLNIELILTMSENQNKLSKKLYRYSKKHELNVEFAGTFTKDKMLKVYCNSILVFPSYIESFGLPLLEARLLNRKIIASNTKFSREILNQYTNVEFFEPLDYEDMAKKIFNTYNEMSDNK